jgi:ribosomal protein L11 methyltransferase
MISNEHVAVLARLRTNEPAAWRVADLVLRRFDPGETAAGVSEAEDGSWIVGLYLGRAPDRDAVRAVVALAAGADAARTLTFETVVEKDWVAASLAGLAPVAAGRFVVHGRHDRARIAVNRIGIEIEAALAFGTGHHGTTHGCLLALDRFLKARKPRRVLDVGTGSGVLAIAAGKARCRVLASDIDWRAVAVARANARANGVAPFVDVICAGGLAGRQFRARAPYDLVLANILLQPLKRLAAPMARLLAPRARVVLSGLLPAHANAALATYRAQGLALEHRILLDGWATLVLARSLYSPPPARSAVGRG